MFQKAFSFAGPLLLAGAAALMMPGLSPAQHGGGGHGGGGHGGGGFGGGHGGGGFGGGHFGGGVSHFGGGGRVAGSSHFSGAPHGGFRGGIHNGGIRYGGYGRYRSYYGGYGYYPYYGSYGGYYPYYDSYPYVSSYPTYDSGYADSYGEVAPDYGYGADLATPAIGDYQQLYPSSTATAQRGSSAHLTVKVPTDAEVWFNNTPTTTTGAVRQFESPPLAAGNYIYDVQARWTENGREVTEMRQVQVAAGSHVEVDFPAQPGKAMKK